MNKLLEAVGGQVCRRSPSAVAEARCDHGIVAFRAKLSHAWTLIREALTA